MDQGGKIQTSNFELLPRRPRTRDNCDSLIVHALQETERFIAVKRVSKTPAHILLHWQEDSYICYTFDTQSYVMLLGTIPYYQNKR